MRKLLFRLAIALFFFTSANAQQNNSVNLYTECNYSGQSVNLTVGNYYSYQMRIPNDRLSSIQVPPGMKLTIYEHDYFQGRSRTYTTGSSCLENDWRNMASSLVVEYENGQPAYSANDYVVFYADCYQRGASQTLRPGRYSGSQLGSLKYNISSFTISGNLRVRLYLNNESYSGYATDHESSAYCLPNNQNDKAGSLIIEYKNNGNNNGNNGNNGGYGNGQYGNVRYATFYSACNFEGNALRLMPGSYTGAKLGLMKNAIESIQVPSGMRVKAYTGSENGFGSSTDITQDINCLDYNLKDRITSLVVEDQYYGGGNNNGNTNETVMIYVDDNYRGQSAALLPGNYPTMAAAGNFPDNAVSSVYIPAGWRVVLYEFENFSGKNTTLTSSRTGFFLTSWNDKTSSIAVYKDR